MLILRLYNYKVTIRYNLVEINKATIRCYLVKNKVTMRCYLVEIDKVTLRCYLVEI